MIEDESYSVVYLYSAVIEYIYFLIILIQDQGPNDLSNVAKHVKFFKKDVYSFVQIFKGSTLTEKVSHMLCSTTSVFEIKDNTLYLTDNHKSFVQIIYKDLLISKVADLILRGIFTVQDICCNLNLSSVINIKEDILIALLNHNPHFYLNSDASVILVQFHGLVGFEKHAYHTTVQYFQSYLQNINLLTYNDIKFHSRFVPSCAVRNSLLIFCILHVSILFKCKNDKVSLRNNLNRKTCHNPVLNIEKVASEISSDSLSIGMLVREIHGPTILCWQGEICSLMKSAGLIQCVVNFTNGHLGIFVIYFYKTALKYVCEIGNMKNFLNVCDIVEFDAEFCGETFRKDMVWQATRIKVVKRFCTENKHTLNLNRDIYMESINFSYHKLKPVLKDCTKKNCLVKYIVLEKETPTETKCSIPEKDASNNSESFKRLNSSDVKEENILKILYQTPKESQEQEALTFNSSKILESCVQGIDKVELENNQLSNTNVFYNAVDISNQTKTFDCQFSSVSDLEIQKMQDKSKGISNGCIKQSIISKDINVKLKNCIKEDIEQNLVNNYHDGKNSGTQSYLNSPSMNSIMHFSLIPNIFNDSSFILGEITFMSTYNGVAQSLQKNKLHEIFFEKSSISFQNGATNALAEGNHVLLFIPYANLEESVLIATLVYPLTYEEKIVIQEKDISAKDFVVNYFFPTVQKSLSKTDFCCCDLLNSLLESDQNFKNCSETLLKRSQFIEQLQELFQFDKRTSRNLFSLINIVCAQNLGVNYLKLLKETSFTFLRSLSWIRHSKNFALKYRQRQKNMNRYKGSGKKYKLLPKLQKEDYNNDTSLTYFKENNIPKISLEPSSIKETYSLDDNYNIIKLNKTDNKLATESSVKKQSCLKISCNSKSSISSFVSCLDDSYSELSDDDVFYSCESDSKFSSVLREIPHSESDNLCDIDKTQNSLNAMSKICNIVSKHTFPFIVTEDLKEMEYSNIAVKRVQNNGDACYYLKLRNLPSFKHRRNKCKIILPSENVFCKSCHQLPLEMTAEISILGQSTLYLRPKCNYQNITLAFPKSIVPMEEIEKIKLNATIKATIVPHLLINFSRVLYINVI